MSEIANKIMETLEGIASDITNAKSTLTQNNVVLESSTTKTLATEINKLPSSIKASPVLEEFNGGTLNLRNGFIYAPNATKLDNTNCVAVNAREYILPRGVRFALRFPGDLADLRSYIGEQVPDRTMQFCNIFKIFIDSSNDVLEALLYLNAAYVDNVLEAKKRVRNYGLKIVINGESFTPDENGYYYFERFIFPSYNSEFYVRQPDGSEVKITKIKCKMFYFTVNYQQKDIDLVCDEINFPLMNLPSLIDKNKQQSIMPNNYNRNLNNADCHIVRMPNVNIKLFGFPYLLHNLPYLRYAPTKYPSSGSDSYLQPSANIQIRVNETPENIEKLKSDELKINLYPFIKIYNADGTKMFNPATEKFGPTNVKVQGKSMVLRNKNGYLSSYSSNMAIYDAKAKQYIPYNWVSIKLRETVNNYFNSINIVKTPGYDDYMYGVDENGYINNIVFNERIPDVFENFPLMKCLDEVLKPSTSLYLFKDLNCSKRLKFKFREDNTVEDHITPLSGFVPRFSINTEFAFNGISLYCDDWETELPYAEGNYMKMIGGARLLVSPFDTDFFGKNGAAISRIFTNKAPIMYNKNIRYVRVASQYGADGSVESNGVIYPLIGAITDYPYGYPKYDEDNGTHIPPVPVVPMKYIIDKDTIIAPYPGYCNASRNSGQATGFEAMSNAITKFEKYIRILAPENLTKLGTYEFNKFRLPLYTLDETKKYNYSTKSWEPVGATTPDTIRNIDLFRDEIMSDRIRFY